MKIETKPYNPVNFFQNDAEIIEYLNNAFFDEDSELFIIALGHVARAKGIAEIAKDTGLSRESLYKSLSGKTQPKFDTVHRIIKALNMNIHLVG